MEVETPPRHPSQDIPPFSHGLWSLREMINFYLHRFILGRLFLEQEMEHVLPGKYLSQTEEIPENTLTTVERHVNFAIRDCVIALDLKEANATCVHLGNMFRNRKSTPIRWGEMHEFLRRLWDEIENALGREVFFHYPKAKAEQLLSLDRKWEAAIKAFPSIKPEIYAGIDCYALGHNVACVFHMCRVSEIGLRAIGIERGILTVRGAVPLEWGTWGQILQAIEPKSLEIRQKQNGPQKDAATAFYDGILADLRAIQRLYRDPSMHLRASYDDGETESAIFRTHGLMTMLAKKLDENTSGEIPWGSWP